MDRKRRYQPHQSMKRNRLGPWIAVGFVVMIITAIGIGTFAYWRNQRQIYEQQQQCLAEISQILDTDAFYEGIFVDGFSLGGKTSEEALSILLENQQQRLGVININLAVGDESTCFTADDMTVTFDTETVLEKAWNIGRQGDRDSRYEYVKGLPDHPMEFFTTMSVDPSPLEYRLLAISESYDIEPVDATVTRFDPDPAAAERFSFSEEVYGLKADVQSAWREIKASVESQQWGQTVNMQTTVLEPKIKLAVLQNMTRIVRFETTMKRDENREHNIGLACSKITGLVINPGEEFSFNAATGPRTYETGYLDAGVIVGGKLDEGVAGGVCQVSGTLFNALVMADLDITKRSHHSYELGYLTRGRDATVDYPSGTDLRCRNNGDYPVYLAMYTTKERKVIAEVYGIPPADGTTIDIEVDTLEEEPPGDPIYIADKEVPAGSSPVVSSGHNYIKCQSYKVYKDAQGKVIRREELILDVYKAILSEIHVNPADMPGAATPTPNITLTPTLQITSGRLQMA